MKHSLLDLQWRAHGDGYTQLIHIEPYHEGVLFVDLPEMDMHGSSLMLTVEISYDTNRWADIARQIYYPMGVKQYHQISLQNFGAYLRVYYQIQGSVQFSLAFVGKSFHVGEPPRAILHE